VGFDILLWKEGIMNTHLNSVLLFVKGVCIGVPLPSFVKLFLGLAHIPGAVVVFQKGIVLSIRSPIAFLEISVELTASAASMGKD
jgi:hypothetical protein